MQEAFQIALQWFNNLLIGYYGFVNTLYTVFLIISVVSVVRYQRRFKNIDDSGEIHPDRAPPITVLLPAYNEQANIAGTVQSLLALNYPSFEVLVINDGSYDETLKRLREAFGLQAVAQIYRPITGTTQPVVGFYKNPQLPVLTVIDKKHGGTADSLNVGINVAQNPYFCPVDGEILLEKNALLRLIRPILESPNRVVASGGIIGMINEFRIDTQVAQKDIPGRTSMRLHLVVFLQRCLFGRMAWGHLTSFVGISKECVLFQKRVVHRVGGYDLSTAIPNMELLLRLRRVLINHMHRNMIIFNPELVGWRLIPQKAIGIAGDQVRWQIGIIGCLLKYKDMGLNPRYGKVGLLTIPLLFITEVLGPFLETFGYLTIAFSMVYGWIEMPVVLLFLFLAVVYRSFLSVISVLAEAAIYQEYRLKSSVRLAVYGILENLGYRQWMDWCRLWAVLQRISTK